MGLGWELPDNLPRTRTTPADLIFPEHRREHDRTAGAGGESAVAAAGRTTHNSYGAALGAQGDYDLNKRMPDSLMRPDAIDHTNRVIRELKPDNPAAIARGWRQVNRYKEYMESTAEKEWTVYVDVYKP